MREMKKGGKVEDYMNVVRDEDDELKRGNFSMEDLFKMFNCNKVVDKQK